VNGGRSALDDLRRKMPGDPLGMSPVDIFLKLVKNTRKFDNRPV
jgi:hypothetical protein